MAAKSLKVDPVQPVNGNGASPSDHDVLRRMYVSMLRYRMLSERAQRPLGDTAPATGFAIGHEAIVVGATLEIGPGDTVVSSTRNFPAQLAKEASPELALPASSCDKGVHSVVAPESPAGANSFDPFTLGTGLALAHRLEKKRNVAVALCAEDTSTPERWHEAMKFAGTHKLPIIYVLKRDSAFDLDPATRNPVLDDVSFVARDCGFPAIIVDSKDAVAVWRVTQESIHRARNGAGPTLIECEIQLAHSSDPLAQMEHYMKKRGAWDEGWKRDAAGEIEAEIAQVAPAGR